MVKKENLDILNVLGITDNNGKLELKKNIFTLRSEYYWRPRMSPEEFFVPWVSKLTAAGYILSGLEYGDHFTSFKGGEGIKKNSHYWMRFCVLSTVVQ